MDGILAGIIKAIWILIPAYAANAFPTLAGGKHPIDGGRKFMDGNRIFGDGKTVEGFSIGILAGIFYGSIQWYFYPIVQNYLQLYAVEIPQMSLSLAFLISLGAMMGDLAGSFVKRRFGMKRGEKWMIDKINFIAGAILFSSLMVDYTLITLIFMFAITILAHRFANIVSYTLKLKRVPW